MNWPYNSSTPDPPLRLHSHPLQDTRSPNQIAPPRPESQSPDYSNSSSLSSSPPMSKISDFHPSVPIHPLRDTRTPTNLPLPDQKVHPLTTRTVRLSVHPHQEYETHQWALIWGHKNYSNSKIQQKCSKASTLGNSTSMRRQRREN
ncbi:unnamed protein product [Orchesella dallaii]|uniref:Uncharacterized protein n=1 Tax=Orchesella dallaii TaxID=48710 RepID=A0ABP1PV80_9HEXA